MNTTRWTDEEVAMNVSLYRPIQYVSFHKLSSSNQFTIVPRSPASFSVRWDAVPDRSST